MKKLNLGSGIGYLKGWINLDISDKDMYGQKINVDKKHDLSKFPYPFKNNEFDYVYASHIIEHLDDPFKVLKELKRITKSGGIIHIRLPHFSNGYAHTDLTHKYRGFGWSSLDPTINILGLKIVKRKFNFLADNWPVVNFLFSWIWNIMPKKFYERFLCWILPVGEIELKLRK